jgi:hypothetical protein
MVDLSWLNGITDLPPELGVVARAGEAVQDQRAGARVGEHLRGRGAG